MLKELTDKALHLGASHAAIIPADAIVVADGLAAMCARPQCENYGLSARCPPHTGGPAEFRELQRRFRQALVFKIDVPSDTLLSSERREIFRFLQGIAADIEHEAVAAGHINSRGYAGGSCKSLFCDSYSACAVLEGSGACRNPRQARASMSGFGINVTKLMKAAGWSMRRIPAESNPPGESLATVCGLVLIG